MTTCTFILGAVCYSSTGRAGTQLQHSLYAFRGDMGKPIPGDPKCQQSERIEAVK